MRITKGELRRIIREEAQQIKSKRQFSEVYDMESARRGEGLADLEDIKRLEISINDMYTRLYSDLIANETDDEDEADDMARATTVLAVAHALGAAGFSAAEVLYNHLRTAGRR